MYVCVLCFFGGISRKPLHCCMQQHHCILHPSNKIVYSNTCAQVPFMKELQAYILFFLSNFLFESIYVKQHFHNVAALPIYLYMYMAISGIYVNLIYVIAQEYLHALKYSTFS